MPNPLLFLHGAIGASDQLQQLQSEFPGSYVFDFPGHGGKAFDAEFSIASFAESVVKWMGDYELSTVDIFGYSMGGYVALYLARHYPEKVGKIMTLATKFAWDEATAQKEVKMLDAGKIAEKVPKFAAALEKRHAPNNWKEVLQRTTHLMHELGKHPALKKDDFEGIAHPVLLSAGDRDTMVSIEETKFVYHLLPNGQLAVFPGTPHPIEQVDAGQVAAALKRFLL